MTRWVGQITRHFISFLLANTIFPTLDKVQQKTDGRTDRPTCEEPEKDLKSGNSTPGHEIAKS